MSKSMVGRIPTKEDGGPGSVGWGECCGNPLRGCPECPPRKLTFEEWMASKFEGVFGYDKTRPDDFILWGMPGRLVRVVWKAAQENK